MTEPAPQNARGQASRRIEEIDDRLERLRHGDPVTAEDLQVQQAHTVQAARRAKAAASRAAEASTRDADLHDRVADKLAQHHPDWAQQHRDAAGAARRRAAEERAIAKD